MPLSETARIFEEASSGAASGRVEQALDDEPRVDPVLASTGRRLPGISIRAPVPLALEGVIGKRAGQQYVSARSAIGIKTQICRLRQEFC